jgi:hypothetical protein
MFPRDVVVHLLEVGMKVLLSSRFGARWRGDEEKLLSLCLDVAVQKMLLVRWTGAAHAAVQQRFCPLQVLPVTLEDGAGHMYVLPGVDCCIERRCRVVCCLQELSK